jgi:hypothetical protein
MFTDKRCPGTILNVDIAPIHGGLWISFYDTEKHENYWEGSLADLVAMIEHCTERDKCQFGAHPQKVGAN